MLPLVKPYITLQTQIILLSDRSTQRLLGHALEGLRQRLGHERQLGLSPDLGIWLERLLDVCVQRASLDGDDFGRRVGVVGDGRAAFRAEDSVNILARGTLARP